MLPQRISRVAWLALLTLSAASLPAPAARPTTAPASTAPALTGGHDSLGGPVVYESALVHFDSPTTEPAAGAATSPTTAPATSPSLFTTGPATQPDFHVDLRQTVEYLAGDALEGRYASSPGNAMAGERIAEDFARLGLKPLPGLEGYFQPFEAKGAASVDPATHLSVGDHAEQLDKDFRPVAVTADGAFDGEVVFAGYGISDPKRDYDDYAGLDVKGKVVLVMRYEPHDADNKSLFTKQDFWSPGAPFAVKCRTAAAHGAAALLVANPPGYVRREQKDAKEPKGHAGHGGAGAAKEELVVFGGGGAAERSSIPVLQVTDDVAEAMIKEGGAGDLAEREAEIDKGLKPESAALKGVTARGRVALQRTVRNVVAYLPGKGEHADEYVVVGAHYDHLGHGGPGSLAPPGSAHAIHHGADDNASGTAAVLAVADDLAHGEPPDRSVLFIAFTAEEEGLIGSNYFVNHCPVPLDRITYMVNLDMVGRLRGTTLEVGGTGTAADLEKVLKDADEGLAIRVGSAKVTGIGGKGGLGPSDHMTFALKKIPVLFFFTGLHADYHRPSDTADKINYWGMQQVVWLTDRVVQGLARHPREQYVGKFDVGALAHMGAAGTGSGTGAGGGGQGAALGVVPDYGSDAAPEHGVRISGTSEGSAAEKAGLKAGDVIVAFGGVPINDLQELSDALARAKPGDKVHLTLLRDGKKIETDAVLTARRG